MSSSSYKGMLTNDFMTYLANSKGDTDSQSMSISVKSEEEREECLGIGEVWDGLEVVKVEDQCHQEKEKNTKKKRTKVMKIELPLPPAKEMVVEDLALTQTLKKIQFLPFEQVSESVVIRSFGQEEAEFVRCLENVEEVYTEPGTWNPAEVYNRVQAIPLEFLKVLSNEELYKIFKVEASFSGCLMKAVSYILHDSAKFEPVMKELVSSEVARSPSSFEILRSNTDQVRSISAVCKGLGRRIIMTAVKPVVEEILNLSSETDLFYLNISDASENILEKLIPFAERIITMTIQSLTISGCQQFLDLSLIRQMCCLVARESLQKFSVQQSGIGVVTLLFLRFICPSVINPCSYGIPIELNSNGQKSLIGLAKLIQSIAGSYSQTESLEDKPQVYRDFVSKMFPMFDHFFSGLVGPTFLIGRLPKECSWEHCIKVIQTYLELLSSNVRALELISPNIGTMSKSGGGFFSNKTRKLLLSLVHAKLYYMRKEKNENHSGNWTGCIDLKASRFEDMPKNMWKGKFSKGNYIKVTHLFGEDMLVKSWKKRNGEFISGSHEHMFFWEHDRSSMLKPLEQIHQAQKSLGIDPETWTA
jgi:hypothetical protein